jgi:hypothetical protein
MRRGALTIAGGEHSDPLDSGLGRGTLISSRERSHGWSRAAVKGDRGTECGARRAPAAVADTGQRARPALELFPLCSHPRNSVSLKLGAEDRDIS